MRITTGLDGAEMGVLLEAGEGADLHQLSVEAMVALQKWGVVVVRAVASVEDYIALSKDICPVFVSHSGGRRGGLRQYVGSDPLTCTVDSGTHPTLWHRESSQAPLGPDVLFFWCERAPAVPAPTLLVDGHRLVEAFPAGVRSSFDQQTIVWRKVLSPDLLSAVFGVSSRAEAEPAIRERLKNLGDDERVLLEFQDDGNLTLEYEVPAIRRRSRWHARPVFSNYFVNGMHWAGWGLSGPPDLCQWPLRADRSPWPVLLGYQVNQAAELICYEHHWQTHDLVIIDQSRVMHGRRRLPHDDNRRIYLRMGMLA